MTRAFFPSSLEIARLRRKLTSAELSKRSGVSTRELRRIFAGEVEPSPESVEAIARALDYPVGFFYSGDLAMPAAATFRALGSMTKMEAGAGKASAALGARLSDWLEREFDVPEPSVPDLTGTEPEQAAQMLREMWGLGERPIGNLVRLLEAKGVRVFSLSEETLRLDAFATWLGARPFVFLNGVKSAERSRFDAAHELGHLCLHRDDQQGKQVEDEANRFAAAFLLPQGDVIARRVFPTLPNLIASKSRWGVALSALVHRYQDLGLLNADRAKWLYIEMSRKGYLKNEPRPMARETSAIWTQVLQSLWTERRNVRALSDSLALPADEVESLIFVSWDARQSETSIQRISGRANLKVIGE
ncbi:Zn-dependent peptidase ImmA (M78 family) [Rhodobacter viridis]|uniref:Zn-dependent peptidase ImmA (M78 family) n=1 Tax=Rhodobacter viridis TaxID=1054202 RepID=A0A318U3A8_9RHOB|nr:XRE family transcriptional regulator [Rhodobacter viridis]PYF12978.1 Zn-dependent peptidase ImmA (M78 family) [Rhodobacter viridis]